MLMEIHKKEKTKSNPSHDREALECNTNFYRAAKALGLDPQFVHTDKDWSEISAVKVIIHESPVPSLQSHCALNVMNFRSRTSVGAQAVGMWALGNALWPGEDENQSECCDSRATMNSSP
jgi:hypothetical protein